MKIKILIIAIAIIGLASCTQKTCPTYAKQDLNKEQGTEQIKI